MKRYKFKPRFYVIVGITTLALAAGSAAIVDSRCKTNVFAGEVMEQRIEYSFLTAEDRDLIERVVAAEARGESLDGMAAVAQSIRDRASSWGKTYADVVSQPHQYAEPYQGEISREVKAAVSAVFDNSYRVFEEPVLYFYNPEKAAPEWAEDMDYLGTIGNHKFFNEGA